MNKIKLVAICGKAGAGKDTFLRRLVEHSNSKYHEIVSCTTRPPREKEVDGINYYFLSNEEFAEKVLNGDMLEATVFNDWCYGTALSNLDVEKINIGVFNPTGIEIISQNDKLDLLVFYITATDKNRLIRQLNREENPNIEEILRRYTTDKSDFEELDFDYLLINNDYKEDLLEKVDLVSRIIEDKFS